MNLTIGICAFNEERNIRTLLHDVINQQGLPENTEVMVVASGCTDKTAAIVREFMKNESRIGLVEEETRTGKTGAINKILSTCRGELLMLIDADIQLSQNSIGEILRRFSDHRIGVVGGLPVVGNPEDGEIAKSAAFLSRVMKRALVELNARGVVSYVMGEMYCFRTSLLKRIPDEIVNDDAYVATRILSRGFKVLLIPEANFVSQVPSSIQGYFAQRRRVTFGHLQIKSRIGRFATSMEGIALYHTSTLVRAIVREGASRPTNIIRILLLLELEVLARLLALLDLVTGRQHIIY